MINYNIFSNKESRVRHRCQVSFICCSARLIDGILVMFSIIIYASNELHSLLAWRPITVYEYLYSLKWYYNS